MEVEKKSKSRKNVLVYFTDPIEDFANVNLFKIWASRYDVPTLNGYDLLNHLNGYDKEIAKYKKVLLFITDLGQTVKFIKKIQNCGFDSENITLFTTHAMQAHICVYAKKKGIKIVLLPLIKKQKLKDFL